MKLYDVYALYDVTPVRGKGARVFDSKGIEYLDFYGGHAVISVGHSHPHYIRRITDQLNRLGFYSNSIINPLQQELAELLESVSGVTGYELFLINSGAEANENALKLASFYQNRNKVLALENSFHGRTSAAINVTHTGQKYQASINTGIDVSYYPIHHTEDILNALAGGEYAAVIIEAIQGIGGLDMISSHALQQISEACKTTDTLLIMDEVQCGYGRSGKFFAYEFAGIHPDLITMAKGMGNGFPVGGVLIDSEKMPAVSNRLGTTYGGNHLACAAALAVLEIIRDEELVKNAERLGQMLRDELSAIPQIKNIKGRGLMIGAEFDFPVSQFRKELVFKQHLFTGSAANPNLIRILPSLAITEEEVSLFIDKLKAGLKEL